MANIDRYARHKARMRERRRELTRAGQQIEIPEVSRCRNTITLTGETTIQAKPQRRPRIVIQAYSGGRMRPQGVDGEIVISLDGIQSDGSVPLLLDHRNEVSAVIGHGTPSIESGGLVLSGELADSAAARSVIALANSGVQLKASVGGTIAAAKMIDPGQSVSVNGRTIEAGPDGLMLVTKFTLHETSVVPIAADASTSIKVAAGNRNRKMSNFAKFARDMLPNANIGDMTETQLATLHANYRGATEPTGEDFDMVGAYITASSADPVEVENRRLRQIEAATRGEWGEHSESVRDLKAKAIGGEIDVDELLQDMREIRSQRAMHNVPEGRTISGTPSRTDNAILEASLCMTGGLRDVEKHYDERTLDSAFDMRGAGLQSLLMQAAVKNGYNARPGEHVTSGNIRGILEYAFAPVRAAGFSTLSLPNILSNVANKFLLEGWDSVDQTALRISGRRSTRDFKTATTVSLLGDMTFKQLDSQGMIQHGELGELTYTNKVDTYARMFTISRQDIINDDVGALSQVPRRIGRGSMLKLNQLFWTLFLDNSSFFTSGNNNVSTGGGSALALTGLQAAEKIFINQTDPDGEPLGLVPAILLVPPTLKAVAAELMTSGLVVTGANTTRPSGNVWQGRFRIESSPYMENSSYTGNSDAAWYLLAEPSALATIEIAALNGRVEPVVDTAEADFSVLGIQTRGYSDVGVAIQEFRAGVRSAGS